MHRQIRIGDRNGLVFPRAQMHLDAALRFIPGGLVFEAPQVEIGTQFTVDATQYIQVEDCRQTGWIVVCGQHAVAILH